MGSKRAFTLLLVGAALALAGLGHYYVLYKSVYIWDAGAFYAVAALLMLWAFHRSEVVSERGRALALYALRRLGIALQGVFLRRPNRLLVGGLVAVNGLAALIAFLSPLLLSLPLALSAVLLLWLGGMVALVSLIARPSWVPGRRTPAWLRQFREEVVRRGVPVPRSLLVVGLVSAFLGQFCFFFSREHPYHVRNGVFFWCVAFLSFGFLLWTEKSAPDAGESHKDEKDDGVVDVSGKPLFGSSSTTRESSGATGARAGSSLPSPRFPRLSWKLLLVVVGMTLVALAAYGSRARAWASPGQVAYGVLLPWISGMVVAAAGLSEVSTWRLPRSGWRRDVPAIAVLLIIALVLRMVGLGRIPDVMSGDEAAMAMEARRILDGNPSNPFRVGVVGFMSHPVVFFYMESLALRWFGWNLFGLRFVAALVGSLGVPAVYLLARSVFGRKVAWVSALLMAGWGLPLHFSRLGLNNSADPLFGALVMWGLHRGLVYGRRSGYILAGLALGLSLYFYHGTHLLILLVPATLLIAGTKRLYRHWRELLILLFCFLLAFGPLLATFIIDPGQFEARYKRQPVLSGLGEGGLQVDTLLKNLGRAAFAFVYTRDVGYFYRPDTPLLGALTGTLFVLGLGLAVWRWREPRYSMLLIWVGLTIVVGGWLFADPPHYQRYLIAAPAVCMLVGRAVVAMSRWVARLGTWRPGMQRVLVAFLAVVLLAVNAGYYFGVYTPAGGFHWDRNTVIADRTARLMVDLGQGYTTYFFGTTHMPLNAFRNLVRFYAPDAYWADVLETPVDWHFVQEGRGACFVFIPERTSDVALVRERFPDGVEWQRLARDEQLLFTVYQVDEVRLSEEWTIQ